MDNVSCDCCHRSMNVHKWIDKDDEEYWICFFCYTSINEEGQMVMLAEGGTKNWLKSSEVETGDVLTILTGGEWVESTKFTYDDGNPVKQFVIQVSFKETEYDLSMNKLSRTTISQEWGTDTDKWVGHNVKVEKVKVMVGGEMKNSLLLMPTTDKPAEVVTPVEQDSPF